MRRDPSLLAIICMVARFEASTMQRRFWEPMVFFKRE
jgi:hypothetical protein